MADRASGAPGPRNIIVEHLPADAVSIGVERPARGNAQTDVGGREIQLDCGSPLDWIVRLRCGVQDFRQALRVRTEHSTGATVVAGSRREVGRARQHSRVVQPLTHHHVDGGYQDEDHDGGVEARVVVHTDTELARLALSAEAEPHLYTCTGRAGLSQRALRAMLWPGEPCGPD